MGTRCSPEIGASQAWDGPGPASRFREVNGDPCVRFANRAGRGERCARRTRGGVRRANEAMASLVQWQHTGM